MTRLRIWWRSGFAAGQKAAFLNLGDVTLYATYLHVHRRIQKRGFQAELINGIPSFCAAAAAFGTGLAEGHEQFHILAKPGQVEEGLSLSGTRVIMKSSRQSRQFLQQLEQAEQEGQEIFLAENCGMPGPAASEGGRGCNRAGRILFSDSCKRKKEAAGKQGGKKRGKDR